MIGDESSAQSGTSSSGAPTRPAVRETLTRVLAREGRSTLARVELAASELARFEASPAVAERLDTIRSAVSEIDAMLGKIDLLAGPPKSDLWPAVEVEPVWRRVLARLSPTLCARGIEARLATTAGRARVALPEATLEAIFCAYVRLLLPAVARSGRLVIEIAATDGTVRVARAGDLPVAGHLDLDPDERSGLPERAGDEALVEFEVLLAEWGGALARARAQPGMKADDTAGDGAEDGSSGRWVFWLPEAGSDV